jgi:uncharacterized membrane protein
MYVFSIVLIIVSNVLYNISQKSTPQNVNPFSALLTTYLTAALLTLIAAQFYKSDKGFMQSFSQLNWTSIALGISIVGLELGYMLAYRAGWNISLGSLVANIILALILIPIGIMFYKEGFELHKILGVAFCIVGLIIINK